jgi:hypothetical protein
MKVYSVLYINTDEPSFSEIYGVYNSKEKAVDALLVAANYRNINGELTQYMRVTDEYDSFEELKTQVFSKNELIDYDIYRISEVYIDG